MEGLCFAVTILIGQNQVLNIIKPIKQNVTKSQSDIYIFARPVYYGAQYSLRAEKANFVFNLLKYEVSSK